MFWACWRFPFWRSRRKALRLLTSPKKRSQRSKPDSAPSDCAGAEACKTCHEDIYNGWEKSPHWKQTYKEGGIAKHGCEDCHGAAAGHVADPADTSKLFLFEKASAKEIDARCLDCHAGGTQHMNAINSEHAKNDVSCIACHSPHHGKESDFLLVKSQPELCYSCHLQQKAQFDMPFHHRVNEGLVQCTDCHNPHGTVKPKQVRTSSTQDAVCFKCHTDKQGPFVFEHQPVKIDGCQSCHLMHGGPNPHMLKLSNVNLLCLQCHTTVQLQRRAGSSFVPQPGELFPVVRVVSLANSRLQLRSDLLQIGAAMNPIDRMRRTQARPDVRGFGDSQGREKP